MAYIKADIRDFLSFGSAIGNPFRLEVPRPVGPDEPQGVRAVHMRVDTYIHQLQVEKTRTLLAVYIWEYKETIRAIQFQTSKERMSDRYGGTYDGQFRCVFGQPRQWSSELTGLSSKNVRVFHGFNVHADDWVRELAVLWRDSDNTTPVLAMRDGKGKYSGYMDSDLTFIPNTLGVYISSILMYDNGSASGGAWGVIDYEITYNRGAKDKIHGGMRGNPDRTDIVLKNLRVPQMSLGPRPVKIDLADGEHITAVEGHASADGGIHRLHFITTHTKTKVVNHSHPVIGGVYGEPFRWDAPRGMILLGFDSQKSTQINYLVPIWGPKPPLSYHLIVDKVDYPEELPTKGVPVTDVARGTTCNLTKNDMTATLKWECKTNLSSHLTVTESKTVTSGFKSSIEIEVSAEAFGIGATTKTGIEFSSETSGTYETEKGIEKSEEKTMGMEQQVTIPPGHVLTHKATYITLQVKDIPWSGHLRADYGNGFYVDTPIEGVYGGSTASNLNTSYSVEPVK
ncbi:hypothetical protein QBC34DRAFT_455079 [Podospora aff. communis PSN243]|uniref:Jacalin-type lectin domain-containing protein n=1 Tax=Podospora aff. communis PSN243 TaxID=3040156 RepID=A0AAV9G5F1_9PEZI|nr:hypothetical protein QBC34DRAFT_455079 [Podospora aff. communis PSN243]